MQDRNDYGLPANTYYGDIDRKLKPLAMTLRELILETIPDVTESIKWGVPVYQQQKLICSVRANRQHINLQFFDVGTSLDDPDNLLEGSGKKLRHVQIHSEKDIRKNQFRRWLKQAAE